MRVQQKQIFIGIFLLWVIILGGFIGMKEWTLRTGTEVLLQVQPVDPRDLFRGDYVMLTYEISRMNMAPDFPIETTRETDFPVYVSLSRENGIAHPVSMHLTPPDGGLFIAGTVRENRGSQLIIDYGIESYFVPEGRGREIESKMRDRGNLQARVVLGKGGHPVLKGLVYKGNDLNL